MAHVLAESLLRTIALVPKQTKVFVEKVVTFASKLRINFNSLKKQIDYYNINNKQFKIDFIKIC